MQISEGITVISPFQVSKLEHKKPIENNQSKRPIPFDKNVKIHGQNLQAQAEHLNSIKNVNSDHSDSPLN